MSFVPDLALPGKERVFYPTDLVVLFCNVFFAVCSFLNTGKINSTIFGVSVDREILSGTLFTLSIPLVLVLIKVCNGRQSRLVRFIRLFYGQLFYITYFTECIWLSQLFSGGQSFDSIFAGIDYSIFKFQPSVELPRALAGNKFVTELLFFSYFSYYFLFTTTWWILFAKGRDDEAAFCVFVCSTAFALLYVWYTFFPVQGPKYYIDSLHQQWYSNFKGFLFTDMMRGIFARSNLAGAAFPSSHVALSVIVVVLNLRFNKKVLFAAVPLTLLLMVATIFLYAHYFIDVLAGFVVGLALVWPLALLYPSFGHISLRVSGPFFRRLGFRSVS